MVWLGSETRIDDRVRSKEVGVEDWVKSWDRFRGYGQELWLG